MSARTCDGGGAATADRCLLCCCRSLQLPVGRPRVHALSCTPASCLSSCVRDCAVREAAERDLMLAEEKRTWDAYELNARNYDRLVGHALPTSSLMIGVPGSDLLV